MQDQAGTPLIDTEDKVRILVVWVVRFAVNIIAKLYL